MTDIADIGKEVDLLRQRCALADRPWTEILELRGADRQRFLNAYVTCDVKGLAAGQGAYGFFTNPQGRVLADLAVAALADRLWVELPAGHREAMAEHLRRFVIADRVEMAALADVVALTLAGPGAEAVLQALAPGVEIPAAPWGHVRMALAGAEGAVVQRAGRLGVPAFTLWVGAAEAAGMKAQLERAGVPTVSPQALEVVRTEAGCARFGIDFGPQNFPQETGAADGVSYTKGCYLGQEVVARIHYRGGVQKTLCGLIFDGIAAPPTAGTPLLFDGREAGTVGTALASPALGRLIGLAILHKRATEPGARLEIGGEGEDPGQPGAAGVPAHAAGGSAEVRALPFVQ
jgi:folate-binding protein YgfZ